MRKITVSPNKRVVAGHLLALGCGVPLFFLAGGGGEEEEQWGAKNPEALAPLAGHGGEERRSRPWVTLAFSGGLWPPDPLSLSPKPPTSASPSSPTSISLQNPHPASKGGPLVLVSPASTLVDLQAALAGAKLQQAPAPSSSLPPADPSPAPLVRLDAHLSAPRRPRPAAAVAQRSPGRRRLGFRLQHRLSPSRASRAAVARLPVPCSSPSASSNLDPDTAFLASSTATCCSSSTPQPRPFLRSTVRAGHRVVAPSSAFNTGHGVFPADTPQTSPPLPQRSSHAPHRVRLDASLFLTLSKYAKDARKFPAA
nr:vegetative cell wall protein gp1-like [Lolium perenne]